MVSSLDLLWRRLETGFPLDGARRHLQDALGADVVAALEGMGVLQQRRAVADTYPCPGPSSERCPRQVIEIDGAYHAVCGNSPAECPDLILAPADVAFLSINPVSLCRSIASTLQIVPAFEDLAVIAATYRVGKFIPEPGIKHSVFLVLRSSARRYAEALDALHSRQDGHPFAVLVPNDHFLTDDVGQSMRRAGVTIVALTDVLGLSNGRLAALTDPLRLFTGLGRKHALFGSSPETVAHAVVRDAGQPLRRIDLDQQQYENLLASADSYDVFADERDRSVRKKSGELHRDVQDSYFRSIRAAVIKTGYFDPNTEGPDLASGKQIFQRARAIFDMKSGKSFWRIFRSVRTDEGHNSLPLLSRRRRFLRIPFPAGIVTSG